MARVGSFGLSLGNEALCMAVWQDDAPTVVVNADGARSSPAYVAHSEGEVVVGGTARAIAVKRPREVLHSLLDVLANAADADAVRQKRLGFDLEVDESGAVTGVVTQPGMDPEAETTTHSLSGMFTPLFKYAKGEVEAYVGGPVSRCTLVLPAAVCEIPSAVGKIAQAAQAAGLEIERVLKPASAALVHHPAEGKAVVVDVGAVSTTVSVARQTAGLVQVLSNEAVQGCNGKAFTKVVYGVLAQEFKRKTKIDLCDDKKAQRKLTYESETCKRALSTRADASVQIEALSEGIDFTGKITSSKYDALCADVVAPLKATLQRIVDEAEEKPARIVLIGGGSNVAAVRRAAAALGIEVVKAQMPEEVAALGAAQQSAACKLTGAGVPVGGLWDKAGKGTAGREVDPAGIQINVSVTSKPVGLRGANGAIKTLAPAGSLLPFEATATLPVGEGSAEGILLQLVEGEAGEAELAALAVAPVVGPEVAVTLAISAALEVTLTARDGSGKKHSVSGPSQ